MSKKIESIILQLRKARQRIANELSGAQSYYDNRTDEWKESDKADEWDEKIECLSEAEQYVGEAIEMLEEIL